MNNNDLVGLAVSIGIHVLVVLLFGFLTMAAGEAPRPDFVEIEFGSMTLGTPVARVAPITPAGGKVAAPRKRVVRKAEPRPQRKVTPPRATKPVNVPKQSKKVVDTEKVQSPRADRVAPEEKPEAPEPRKTERNPEESRTEGAGGGAAVDGPGSSAGAGTTGAGAGEKSEGAGASAGSRRGAPFSIEGLNRGLVSGPLPQYAERVNATVRVRIFVAPDGRVINMVPLMKGSPGLDQAVLRALRQWRFNSLPPNAPQSEQNGIVTFRFRLE